jgi:hypothetical protein
MAVDVLIDKSERCLVLIEISYRMDSLGAQKGECRVHPGQVIASPTAENIMYMKG